MWQRDKRQTSGIRGWEAEPTDTLFFSSMRKGSLPPEFASLEETSLDHWKGAAALDAAAVLATGGGAMCAALGTFNNELVPAPKTSFAASMCTEVVFKTGWTTGSQLNELSQLRLPVVPKSRLGGL